MAGDRDAISIALFNLLQKANGPGPDQFPFGTFVRRGFAPGKLLAPALPAAMLIKGGEFTERRPGMGSGLTRLTLDYGVLIYAIGNQSTSSPNVDETMVNAILDALDISLTPIPQGEKQTLGGLVEDAWIEGKTDIANAILDQHIVIWIPIKVLVGRWQLVGQE